MAEEPHESVRALTQGLGYVAEAQLGELATAYAEDPSGFERCVRNARRGQRPVGLLVSMVRQGTHRGAAEDGGVSYRRLAEPV